MFKFPHLPSPHFSSLHVHQFLEFDWLADQIVQLRADPLSHDELVVMLKERLKPIRSDSIGKKQQGVFVLNQLLWVGAWLMGFPLAVVPVIGTPIFYAMTAAIMA